MRLAIGLAAGLILLVGTAGAEAAQRYAAPSGSGSACTQQQPCTLAEASNGANNGDEVIVAAGDYEIKGAPLNVVAAGLQIHGDVGGPMPRVFAGLGGLPAINLSGEGVHLSYLEVQNEETEGTGVRCTGSGTVVERARATGIGEGAAGVVAFAGCTVRDSLLQGRGGNAIGLESLGNAGTTSSSASNVTAIASGQDSAGIQSRYSDSGSGGHTLTLINSIADGASDLRTEDSGGGAGRIVVSNSNFDSVKADTDGMVTGAANQTATPLFLDPAAGDYREAPGSPTIDAGAPREAGALDLAGNPRTLGPAPDIGAFESIPPPVAAAITSLAVSPKAFKPRKRGPAIVSATGRSKAKAGATIRYTLSAAAAVEFTIERAIKGRLVGGKCRKQTNANRTKKKCTRFKALKGAFSHAGVAGPNSFKFAGRLRGRGLAPGRYRLVAGTGDSTKRAGFRIVR